MLTKCIFNCILVVIKTKIIHNKLICFVLTVRHTPLEILRANFKK